MCAFKNWIGGSNKIRLGWGIFYLTVGAILLILLMHHSKAIAWLNNHWIDLFWVVGWSSFGVGAGLTNSRTIGFDKDNKDRSKQNLHYIFYFTFAIFIASLASLALSREAGLLDYLRSALIAVTIGFAAERLNDLTLGK